MWSCPKCHAQVDDEFEVCWSCGTSAEGVEDPEFVTADEAEPITDPPLELVPQEDDLLGDGFAGTPIPDLVACYWASSTIEAKFVADRLMEQGIPAVADTHDFIMGVRGFKGGPGVRVRPEDLPRAMSWVQEYEEHHRSRHGYPK